MIVQNGLGEKGFGWMFSHGGQCYAVLPRHVAGPLPRVTVSTAAPVSTGTGTVLTPFWDGIDLALLVVRGEAAQSCVGQLDALRPDAAARRSVSANLLRLLASGEEERVSLRIENRNYLTFDGVVTTSNAEVAQGTSGAFAFIGDQPVGMAITSTGTERATFMRAEEIHMHLGRYLAEQGGAYVAPPAQPVQQAETNTILQGAVALHLEGASMPPTNPSFAPENLLEDGLFVFDQTRTMRMTFRMAEGGLSTVRQVQVVAAAAADSEYATPKTILVQYSLDSEGPSFREWIRGQMAPDGVFDTGLMSPRNMRRMAITILDTWSDGTVAIDQVVAN